MGGSLQSASKVRCGMFSLSHKAATIAASSALCARRPWSTVAASTNPGRVAAPSSSSARLSGPPETAMPIGVPAGTNASRSAAKRSIASAAGIIGSAALRLGLGAGQGGLERCADLSAVDVLKFRVGLACLARLAELHQRLAEVEQAVLGALALGVAAIIGEECLGRRAWLALVEQRPAE